MSEQKIRAWQAAGLIDGETAGRLRAWEAEHARPVGIWAIVGLGALTIGLGVILVVAANWDRIPGELRLSVHFALMAMLAAWLWTFLPKAKLDFLGDSVLVVAAALGLTFLAHLGQVYQTASPLWQPMLLWLVVFSPLLLSFGRGWPVASLWMAGVLGTAWAHASDYSQLWLWSRAVPEPNHPALYWGLICSPPMIIASLGAAMRGYSHRPSFWRLLEQLAVVTILMGLTVFIILRRIENHWHYLVGGVALQSLMLILAAAVTLWARPTRSGRATAGLLAASATLHLGQSLLLDLTGRDGGPWTGAFLFLLLWASVAAAARYAAWRDVFQLAIGLIALRIILLSVELNTNLLDNGLGLILAGAFAILVAWLTIKVARRYAPTQERRHDPS